MKLISGIELTLSREKFSLHHQTVSKRRAIILYYY